jgi:hypothetical protein
MMLAIGLLWRNDQHLGEQQPAACHAANGRALTGRTATGI